MLFLDQDAPELKRWIVKRLENTSDADTDVLADYIIALLKGDGSPAEIREVCEKEIPDFLHEDASAFIQEVFTALQYKLYLPGATMPTVSPSFAPFAPPTGPSAQSLPGLGMPPMGPQNLSRKRAYNDDVQMQNGGYYSQNGDTNGRAFKQARRGSNAGRGDINHYNNGRGGFQGRTPTTAGQGAPPHGYPPMSSPPSSMPPLDPNNPMAALMALQAMGMPFPAIPGFGGAPAPGGQTSMTVPAKARCRDYDQRGFCARGHTCMYEHGQNSIYMPPASKNDEYDPTNSNLVPSMVSNNGHNQNFSNDRGASGRARGGFSTRGGPPGNNRKNGRSEYSSDRPSFDKSNPTIVVENIPEEKFTEEEVSKFFSEFGSIEEITMKAYKRLAIVKFTDWSFAKAAYSSPKVIFDNRFVKVYWFTNDGCLPKPPATGGARNGTPSISGPVPARDTEQPQIDIEEFTKKQVEVQKAFEEKQKKKLEMENMRKDLGKRQAELLESQAEEKRKLMEKIAAKSGGKVASPDDVAEESGDAKPPSESSLALKAQLAKLQAEADALGLDSTALTEEPAWDTNAWGSGRGGYRGRGRGGRGRGGLEGRGGLGPRGRGGWRGGRGGAAPYAGGSVYKLDNRPKKISITGADFTVPDNNESLRTYLMSIGEEAYTDIEATHSKAFVTFKERFQAEKFMYSTPEIPSVGKVELAWVQTPLPPVAVPNAAKPAPAVKTENTKEDVQMGEGDAMAHSPARAGGGNGEIETVDYDVADDSDWVQ